MFHAYYLYAALGRQIAEGGGEFVVKSNYSSFTLTFDYRRVLAKDVVVFTPSLWLFKLLARAVTSGALYQSQHSEFVLVLRRFAADEFAQRRPLATKANLAAPVVPGGEGMPAHSTALVHALGNSLTAAATAAHVLIRDGFWRFLADWIRYSTYVVAWLGVIVLLSLTQSFAGVQLGYCQGQPSTVPVEGAGGKAAGETGEAAAAGDRWRCHESVRPRRRRQR